MGRAPSSDKDGLKKGPWTSEEDQKLIEYLNKHGDGRWRTVPKGAGLNRCGKSCRLRWTNYLKPDIKRGRFTFEEEETIIQLHSILGNKWSAMAAKLPGRTDNEIKNYWNTHIRKKLLKMGIDPVTHKPRMDLLELCSIMNSPLISSLPKVNFQNLPGMLQNSVNANLINLITSLALSQGNHLQYSPRNLQLNQYSNLQVQPSLNPFISSDTQLNQAPFEQYSSIISSNSPELSQNSSSNLCHQFSNMAQNPVPLQDVNYNSHELHYPLDKILSNNKLFPNSKISNNNWKNDFGSVMSTPSSSSTLVNSSSSFVKGSSVENEDSYCSNIMSKIINHLDLDDFLCN